MEERCVICGEPIPEGRQVCPNCEKYWESISNKNAEEGGYSNG